ncbi:MAG: oligosaccharide flippase family protein [Candidatus Neomarinimicrobiota bacterium]|nr:oligosaccharide flippase family protein [Candidatus Neomarinimicrobiota bacterium]
MQTLVYGAGNVMTRLVTFLLLPLFTNVLSPEEYGLTTLLYVFLGFMNILYHYGLDAAFMRYYSNIEVSNEKLSLFSTALWLGLATSIALSIVIMLSATTLSSLLLGSYNYANLFRLAAAILLLDAVSHVPFALLRLENRAIHFVTIKFINVMITLGMNIYLVVIKEMGLDGVFISVALASAATTFSVLVATLRSTRLYFNATSVGPLLRFGLPFLPAGLATIAMESIDRYILAALTDAATVGVYSAGYKLGIFMLLLTAAFQYAWQPFFLKAGDRPESKPLFSRVFTNFMVVALFTWTVLTLFLPEIIRLQLGGVWLVGPAFHEAESIVPIILMAYLLQGAYLNFLPGIYFASKTIYIAGITGLSALINIGVNFSLIPLYGMTGAAYATLAGHGAMAILTYFVSRKLFTVPYDWFKLLRLATTAVIALGVAQLLDHTLVGRFIGVASFVGGLFLMKILSLGDFKNIVSLFRKNSLDSR